jgi:hypothetical protein
LGRIPGQVGSAEFNLTGNQPAVPASRPLLAPAQQPVLLSQTPPAPPPPNAKIGAIGATLFKEETHLLRASKAAGRAADAFSEARAWDPFTDGPRKRAADPAEDLFAEPERQKAPALFSDHVLDKPARKRAAKAAGKKKGQKNVFEDDDDFLTGQAEKKKPHKDLFEDEDDILVVAPSPARMDHGKQAAPVDLFADDDLLIAPVVTQRQPMAPEQEEEEEWPSTAATPPDDSPSPAGSPE